MVAEVTTARKKLDRFTGRSFYARLSEAQCRRIYVAAWTAHAAVYGAAETRRAAEHSKWLADTASVVRERDCSKYTRALVAMVINDLCMRDTAVIEPSAESLDWSSMEGGHKIFHASSETIATVEAFMAP